MAIDVGPSLIPGQKLNLSPQLQQAIKLLQLTRVELQEAINTELLENPALEIDDHRDAQGALANNTGDEDANFTDSNQPEDLKGNVEISTFDRLLSPDWQQYLDNHANDRHDAPAFDPRFKDNGTPDWENKLTKKTTLEDHLVWQLRLSKLTDQQERIGLFIIGNLDDNGYLAMTVEELTAATSATVAEVETALKQVQYFDPVGIAARDLRECLLIQLASLGLADSLAGRIVANYLERLESKRYEKIALDLEVSVDDILGALHVIASLEPRPSRGYEQDEAPPVVPDVFIEKNGGQYIVRLNDDDLPRLRVSALYNQLAGKDGAAETLARRYLKERIRAATWFIDSIEQRQRTLRKVMESILKFQHGFIENGISQLRPLILSEVAKDIGMHESTVSRVTSNKWVDTPHGIFELKKLFQRPIPMAEGDMTSECVKTKIRELISKENPRKPCSDQDIVQLLTGVSIKISRRTVAKYRESMAIPPSWNRRDVSESVKMGRLAI